MDHLARVGSKLSRFKVVSVESSIRGHVFLGYIKAKSCLYVVYIMLILICTSSVRDNEVLLLFLLHFAPVSISILLPLQPFFPGQVVFLLGPISFCSPNGASVRTFRLLACLEYVHIASFSQYFPENCQPPHSHLPHSLLNRLDPLPRSGFWHNVDFDNPINNFHITPTQQFQQWDFLAIFY